MIVEQWDGTSAVLTERIIAIKIAKQLDIKKDEVYDKHYLDFEDIYREKGWIVEYNKPGYNETYSATYEFTIYKP